MLKILNLDSVFAEIDAWEKQVEQECIRIAILLTSIAFGRAVGSSPQYSGDFAANWRLSVNKIDVAFQSGIFPDKQFPTENPFQRGDTEAVYYALNGNLGKLENASFGDTLWIANSSQHDDLYAWKIEDNLIRLRPQNFGGDGPIRGVKEYMKASFGTITKSSMEFLK